MRKPAAWYDLYERSVQSPKSHIDWVVSIYHDRRGRYPVHLREDFCGTFQLSCAWVRRNRKNTAICLDLDSEPLAYGKRKHYALLTPEQRRRLRIHRKNVLSVTSPKADVILVGNFSFFILRRREELLAYFANARRSLGRGGVFLLEMAGGPGMIGKMVERRTVRKGKGARFVYLWEQKDFDPIANRGQYAIHFLLPNGNKIRDAFTYDWRLWSIPEVRDALREVGFSDSVVYWETSFKGEGTGEFLPTDAGDNAYSWIAYVVGLK